MPPTSCSLKSRKTPSSYVEHGDVYPGENAAAFLRRRPRKCRASFESDAVLAVESDNGVIFLNFEPICIVARDDNAHSAVAFMEMYSVAVRISIFIIQFH